MFESNFYLLDRVIDMYNRSDVVILPTKAMHDYLIEKGMTTSKVLYQEVWDHPVNIDLPRPEYQKSLVLQAIFNAFPLSMTGRKISRSSIMETEADSILRQMFMLWDGKMM